VLGGDVHAITVAGPLGRPTPATLLLALVAGRRTGFVESAQACGVALLPRDAGGRNPEPDVVEAASTWGVGEIVAAAVDAGAGEIVVGLGGSGTNDGGAGMLGALGAVAEPVDALSGGAAGLPSLRSVDLHPARDRLGGCRLTAASDVTSPLLGLRGATNVYGPQKGLSRERLFVVDGALSTYAHLVDRDAADAPGAGAAGGLGYALTVLGAEHRPGIELVAQASGLATQLATADLVLTGEGTLDPQTFTGKVVAGVAGMAGAAGVACVALAGRLEVGSRELRAAGVDGAYSMVDTIGVEPSMMRPAESLAQLAERVARTWGR
jgi:glycerate kinase